MAESALNPDMVQFFNFMSNIDPATNPYVACAGYIRHAIAPVEAVGWLHNGLYFFIVLFATQLFISLATLITFVMDDKFWFFRRGRGGVWLPHTRVLFSMFSAIFSVIMMVNVIWQILSDLSIVGTKNRVILEGIRWNGLWLLCWTFTTGVLTQIFSAKLDAPIGSDATRLSRYGLASVQVKRSVMVWNTLIIAIPLLVLTTSLMIFGMANRYLNSCLELAAVVRKALILKSVEWVPGEDAFSDIILTISPTIAMYPYYYKFKKWYNAGWILWASMSSVLLLGSTPFMFKHLSYLRKLMGAKSMWAAMMGRTSPCEELQLSTPQEQQHHRHRKGSISHGDSDNSNSNEPSMERIRQDYKSLLWVATAIVIATAVYVPLSVWAAWPTQTSPLATKQFWIAQLIWGNGVFSSLGIFVNGSFLYRSISSINYSKQKQQQQRRRDRQHSVSRCNSVKSSENSHSTDNQSHSNKQCVATINLHEVVLKCQTTRLNSLEQIGESESETSIEGQPTSSIEKH